MHVLICTRVVQIGVASKVELPVVDGRGGTGMAYEEAMPSPPFFGFLGSLSRLCHPTLVSLEIGMQTPFYLILMLISHA